MNLPENDYQILKLTEQFFKAYPNPPYNEILRKDTRSYNCLLFQTHYDYFICVPYRSEIIHRYAYRFKKSKRSKEHKSGLDYTKIVIINKNEYIDAKNSIIDADEYRETINNFNIIKRKSLEYVEEYILHMKNIKKLDVKEFNRKYLYSTLKYFHEELGIM